MIHVSGPAFADFSLIYEARLSDIHLLERYLFMHEPIFTLVVFI